MRNIMLLAIALAVALTGVAQAAPPPPPVPLTWRGPDPPHSMQPVEQDNFAVNPTGCPWDVDDYNNFHTNNTGQFRDENTTFASGATITLTTCLVADTEHVTGFGVSADHPNYEGTVTFSSYVETRSFHLPTPTLDGLGHYSTRGCVTTPTYQTGPPTYQIPIQGSTGMGVPTTITVTVHNSGVTLNSDRRHLGLTAAFDLNPTWIPASWNDDCPGDPVPPAGPAPPPPGATPETGIPINHQPWFDPLYRYLGLTTP